MPIYEFYCRDCHTIFNFFSRRINTKAAPSCPKCHLPQLERQVSLFSVSKGLEQNTDNDALGDIDESKLESAMMSLASEMEGVDEDDPKQAARLMRKLFDSTGMKLGDGMEEAIRRMEAGEDPDEIEQDMGGLLEEEDPFMTKSRPTLGDLRRKYLPPKVDETLYEL
jgi:putative FmdB family regulatory protein